MLDLLIFEGSRVLGLLRVPSIGSPASSLDCPEGDPHASCPSVRAEVRGPLGPALVNHPSPVETGESKRATVRDHRVSFPTSSWIGQ